VKMPYHRLNIPYDSEKILSEVKDLDYQPLVQHLDNETYPNWLLADLPKGSYTEEVCDEIVRLFDTRLLVPARALRFKPPQVNESHVDGPLARGVINIIIEDGFQLEVDGVVYDLHTSIFDIKKEHRLCDIHSPIHIIRMDVHKMYDELLSTAKEKNLIE